jgi:hypothetical protein
MAHNYIYLIHIREFVNNGDNVYKIGKTKQKNLKRFNNYPNGSELLFHCICDNCDVSEKDIINMFDSKYIKRKEFGNEYYEGDYRLMIYDIFTIIDIKNEKIKEEVKEEIDEVKEEEVDLEFIDFSTFVCDDTDINRKKSKIDSKFNEYIKKCNPATISFNNFVNNITCAEFDFSDNSIISLINNECMKYNEFERPIYCIKYKNEFITKVKIKKTWKTFYTNSLSQFKIHDLIDIFTTKKDRDCCFFIH